MADRTFPIIRLVLNDIPVEFSDSDILECRVVQECSIISAELPLSTVSLRIFTTDPRFSIFSDGVFYNSLARNIPVDVLKWEDEVVSDVGRFYLDAWEMESENILNFEFVLLIIQ